MACGEATPYKYLGRREENRGGKEAWSRREKNGGGRRGGLPNRRREQIEEVLGEVDRWREIGEAQDELD
jgi:hypothetical protein